MKKKMPSWKLVISNIVKLFGISIGIHIVCLCDFENISEIVNKWTVAVTERQYYAMCNVMNVLNKRYLYINAWQCDEIFRREALILLLCFCFQVISSNSVHICNNMRTFIDDLGGSEYLFILLYLHIGIGYVICILIINNHHLSLYHW